MTEGAPLTLRVLHREHTIEATDCWLRSFQELAAKDDAFFFHGGYYCWNNRCMNCRFELLRDGKIEIVQGCQVAPRNGDEACSLPHQMIGS